MIITKSFFLSWRKAAQFLLFFAVAGSASAQATKEDDRPVVDESKQASAKHAVDPKLPSFFIVGDSTARSDAPMRGWADEIAPYFDLSKINVINRAIGGRSSRTYIQEGRWDKVLSEMKAGDFVLVQFGHNDVGPLDIKGKFRGSIRSAGEETENITKPDGSIEVVHSYGWYLKKYIQDAKAKGISVILATPVPHKEWANDFAEHRKLANAVARETQVPLIDVTAITGKTYDVLGKEKVDTLFSDQRTHTNIAGARINAESVVAGIKGLSNNGLNNYLSLKAGVISPQAD
ncbi:rhamnogalacturonan acetylesterase [Undibacterium sp. CY18W]|uniref:Rhamnogalacturonan acetylesterase n=1 Tax=Undibacterium hunanense TaxID=2762292 RepID=A0ABR6ZMV4_9BURK|nr:rhamnogalacturonan acetylesterase [Undibacterium hunanense]MBC3917227.1 rhamnogalacturonan acetylesterase [Undibacterium hunanense]